MSSSSSAVLLRTDGCGLDGVGVATSRSNAVRRVGVRWSGTRAVGAGRFSKYGRSVGGPLSASLKAAPSSLGPLLCGGMLILEERASGKRFTRERERFGPGNLIRACQGARRSYFVDLHAPDLILSLQCTTAAEIHTWVFANNNNNAQALLEMLGLLLHPFKSLPLLE